MVNPCCMPLQRGVKIMAIIDIILDTINVVILGFALVGVTAFKDRLDNDISDNEIKVATGVLAFGLILAILGLFLSIRLLVGAKRRDIRNCKIWLIFTCIITTINVISTIVNSTSGDADALSISISALSFVYRLYMIWVVYCFIQELKLDATGMAFQARLEEGIGYTMQTYPQYPQQQTQPQPTVFIYPGQQQQFNQQPPPPYAPPHAQPNSNGNTLYNENNQYYTTGNI